MQPIIKKVPGTVSEYRPAWVVNGRTFWNYADAARHRRTVRKVARPVAPITVAPVLSAAVVQSFNWTGRTEWANVQSSAPMAELFRLKRELRIAKLQLSSLATISAAPWSPIHRWKESIRAPFIGSVSRLRRRIAEHRKRFNLPAPKVWKMRPATSADRRITAQYHCVTATASAWA